MTSTLRTLCLSLTAAACLSACGGPPLSNKDDLARVLTGASIPTTHAKGALAQLYASKATSDYPAFTISGVRSGNCKITVNPVGVIVGVLGKGVMLDILYDDFSEDGLYWLDGSVSLLANFDYVAEQAGEDPYADVKLTAVGRLKLNGLNTDVIHSNISLTTRFHDLEFHEGSIQLRLNGAVDALDQRFEFDNEDLAVLWEQATAAH